MATERANRPATGRWCLTVLACLGAWSVLHAQDEPPPFPKVDFSRLSACPVGRVIDGDTVGVLVEDREIRLTLAGVGIPKPPTARRQLERFLENLLTGEEVFVEYDKKSGDSDGAKFAYLFRAPDGLFVNLEAVRQGYASVPSEPACEHAGLFRHYEQRAREVGKGIWASTSRSEAVAAVGVATVPATPEAEEIIVYVTKSGKKYHRAGCSYLSKS
jgi:micrococcal nuclease